MSTRTLLFATALAVGACSDGSDTQPQQPEPEPSCEDDADCEGDAPVCNASGECEPLPPGAPIGVGDGSASSVNFTVVLDPGTPRRSTDLGFDPSDPSVLWVLNSQDDSVIVVTNPSEPDAEWTRIKDPAADHFMNAAPAIAFGAVSPIYGQTFAVCGDSDNHGTDFMGPALFSADLDIFATQNETTGLGSHLDMLHSTIFCRGIAFGSDDDAYYLFNSDRGTVDKYHFNSEHEPGEEDHSDGEIFRYGAFALEGLEGVPSHLTYDPSSKLLYISDTGTGRVLSLDTASGTLGNEFSGPEDAFRVRIDDPTYAEVVASGTLTAPSGIELFGGLLYVSDNQQSLFYAFELDGTLVRTLDTGLPPGSLAGFTFGPDGKIYFVDMLTSRVLRIDRK